MWNRFLVAAVVISAGLPIPLMAQDWPAFRGPAGDGVATVESAPLRWGADENIAWRAAMPHPANGSPIVAKHRVFVTSALDPKGIERALLCFDRKDGVELWRRGVRSKFMPTHKTNPYCGTTPVTDGERVVVWHGSAGLFCYDFDGEELWKRDLGTFRHRWGYGTSPILHGGTVILHSGPGQRVFVAAFSLADGATVWKRDEPVEGDGQDNLQKRYMGSWSSPIVARVAGEEQVICALATRLVAYAPNSGEILWWCDGIRNKRGDLAYQCPSIADGILTFISGYSGPGLGIRLDAESQGDVTSTHRLWRHMIHNQSIGSGVVVEGLLFSPAAGGHLVCLDPKTGETRWKQRAVKGQLWSSIISAAGRLYVTNQAGTTIVFAPDPKKLRVLATNELGETCNATMAVSNGEIFIRTYEHLYCIADG